MILFDDFFSLLVRIFFSSTKKNQIGIFNELNRTEWLTSPERNKYQPKNISGEMLLIDLAPYSIVDENSDSHRLSLLRAARVVSFSKRKVPYHLFLKWFPSDESLKIGN